MGYQPRKPKSMGFQPREPKYMGFQPRDFQPKGISLFESLTKVFFKASSWSFHHVTFHSKVYETHGTVRILERSVSLPSVANEDEAAVEEEQQMIVEVQGNEEVAAGTNEENNKE